MAVVRVTRAEGGEREIEADAGRSLLAALHDAGIYVPAVCGGQGSCGKCRVRAHDGFLPVNFSDKEFFSQEQLEAGYRLACAVFPDGDIGIEVFETGEDKFSVVNDFRLDEEAAAGVWEDFFCLEKDGRSLARRLAPDRTLSYAELREASKLADAQAALLQGEQRKFSVYREQGRILSIGAEPPYAVAVDIGTTTLAMALLDLRNGRIAGRFSAVNRQREAGGDVISRIQYANDGGLARLSLSVREQISEGIVALCRDAAVEANAVRKIAIVGNTAMLHLLLQLSCRTLGQTPFTPVTLDTVTLMSDEIFDGDFSCETVVLPGISAYVGADITAGLLFAGITDDAAPAAFMDIGTNGEIALVYGDKILCTATAAGPAFEGGNIRWGTGSVPGAISRACFRDGKFECTVIGGRPPAGICGSAVVDIVCHGLKNGLIRPDGRFDKELLPTGKIFLAKAQDDRDIVFCQKDVRELQLGKSAVRTGFDALLNYAGLGYGDIGTLCIAGGFGFNMDMESAAGIGLIPRELLPKVFLLGNSALGGAVKFLLCPEHEEKLYRIARKAEEFSLPEDRYFNQYFIDNINFEAASVRHSTAD